jgi:uncharacterized protein YtpQ (UPF0354 family)
VVNSGDGCDAERLLVPGLLEGIRQQVGAPILLTVPSPNWLVVTAETPTSPQRLQQVIQRIQQQEPLTLPPLIFRFDQELAPYG